MTSPLLSSSPKIIELIIAVVILLVARVSAKHSYKHDAEHCQTAESARVDIIVFVHNDYEFEYDKMQCP